MGNQPDFAFYRAYLEAGITDLKDYLLSEDLFWPLNISSLTKQSYPHLTLGGLLLFRKQAQPLAQTTPHQITLQKLETQLEAQRSRWRVAWERKAAWEFQSRLRQWSYTLKEIRENPQENASYYRYEVRLRVILALLLPEIDAIDPAYPQLLQSEDLLLQALLQPGEFIWQPEWASTFPQGEYWYLWGLPREQ